MANLKTGSGCIIEIQDALYEFVKNEVVVGTSWDVDKIFEILGDLVEKFGPNNKVLLRKREEIQAKIDEYYVQKRNAGWNSTTDGADKDAEDLENFLMDIGYISKGDTPNFQMTTPALDYEMDQNGPELVTPATNASMVVGGANARWGSLYDAYFLSDIKPDIDRDTQRTQRLSMVVDSTNQFLDQHVVSWENGVGFGDISRYSVNISEDGKHNLLGTTWDGLGVSLLNQEKFVGFNLSQDGSLTDFLLRDNGLCIQCQLYEGGKVDPENGQFKDLIVESSVTNIIDFEDSVSIVDVDDMVGGLRNYLQLIKGNLQAYGSRGNLKAINSDKMYSDINGDAQALKGTCLMSVRNVSLHMYTDMVKVNGLDIPERFLGLLLTTFIAAEHDKGSNGEEVNSVTGSQKMPIRAPNSAKGFVYQVTPKLHTSEEVAEQIQLFESIENHLGMPIGAILIGIMNEELGMTLQLPESLKASQNRTFFINTGFLDRTGSQIRAQMYAGPVDIRDDLTQAKYNSSYELHNVQTGIRKGVHRHGKIGKGMQVRNRSMAEMMETKINHPRTGGNTAWVPAPYPSDLHSMHYHMIDVDEIQRGMENSSDADIPRKSILTFPVLDYDKVADPLRKENLIQRYIHSMLAYAEPWVNRGIGCSGVKNFDGVEEMKDRATERIDGAILANWKLHGVLTHSDIESAIVRVAEIIDQENIDSSDYVPMMDTKEKRDYILSDPAVVSVLEVIDQTLTSPSGYVEPALFKSRRSQKD